MADIVSKVFNSYLSTLTTLTITALAVTPRSNALGSHAVLTVRIHMGAGDAVPIHAVDPSYGRKLIGTINGHDIGEHLIKPHATIGWAAGVDYDYTLEFDLPYSAGTVPVILRIVQETGSTGALGCFDTGKTYTGTGSVGTVPGLTSNIAFDTTPKTVANLTGSATLTWSAASGTVLGYDVYYLQNNLWKHIRRTTGLYALIPLQDLAFVRGSDLLISVAAYGYYGSAPINEAGAAALHLAMLPLPPTTISNPPATSYGRPLTLRWSGATAVDGTITEYKIQVARLPKNSGTWSNWVTVTEDCTAVEYSHNPSAMTEWTAALGDQFQYRVYAISSYGLTSQTAKNSGGVLLRNGIIRPKVGGTWYKGIPYIKVHSVWRQGRALYRKVAGVWKESI